LVFPPDCEFHPRRFFEDFHTYKGDLAQKSLLLEKRRGLEAEFLLTPVWDYGPPQANPLVA